MTLTPPFANWLKKWGLSTWYLMTAAGLCAIYVAWQKQLPYVWLLWPALVGILIVLLFAMELFGLQFLRDVVSPAERRHMTRQWNRIRNDYSWRDLAKFAGNAGFAWFFSGTLIVVAMQLISSAIIPHSVFLQGGAAAAQGWPAFLRVMAPLLFLDGCSYARHRLEHASGETTFLWHKIHARHHQPTEINLWTGMRVHPLEPLGVFAVPTFVFGCFGWQLWELMFLFTLFMLFAGPQHMSSGWRAGWVGVVINGPETHVAHHALDAHHRRSNFGDIFSIWDRMFGTRSVCPEEMYLGPFGFAGEAQRKHVLISASALHHPPYATNLWHARAIVDDAQSIQVHDRLPLIVDQPLRLERGPRPSR